MKPDPIAEDALSRLTAGGGIAILVLLAVALAAHLS